MIGPEIQQLAQHGAEHVLNSIPAGLLIAAFAWLLLRLTGKHNSGTRFAVWFCALLAVAGLPFMASAGKASVVAQTLRSEIVLPGIWAVAMFAVWTLVVALATSQIVAGLWKLRRLRNSSVAVAASSLPPAIREVVAQFQDAPRVAVCRSSEVTVPTAIGFFRPAILIPDWVLQELSAEELGVVLLHEFAHLQRWDDWTNLSQKVFRTIFFFHPAVWWIERRLTLEREMACDDLVLAKTENPRAYAECLVSLAEKSFVRRGLALAQALIGHARDTSLRLSQILDGNRPDSSRVFGPALGMVTAIVATGLIAFSHAPIVIAFEDAAPTATGKQKVVAAQAIYRPDVRPATIHGHADARQKPQNARPVIIRASAEQEMPAPQFVFVMQTRQYDEHGSAIMSLCVWRVTFDGENQQIVRPEFIVRTL